MYPRNDKDLRKIIRIARKNGCRVRPVGTAHSMGGLVAQKTETNVVTVNLADFKPPHSWNMVLDESRLLVRMPAGATLLDLYAFIRPKGYLLPSIPSTWIFSLAGVFMTPSVHGGTIEEDRLTTLLTGVRAMLPDGRVVDVTNEKQMRAWRGSMGLLGIATALEIRVRKDNGIKISRQSLSLAPWGRGTVVSAFKKSLIGADAAQWFWDTFNDDVLTIKMDYDGAPGFDFSKTADFYKARQAQYPTLGRSSPVSPFQQQVEADAMVLTGQFQVERGMKFLAGTIDALSQFPRDGFILLPDGAFFSDNVEAQVPCPGDCITDGTLYGLMDVTRKYLRKVQPKAKHFPTGPISIRLITVKNEHSFELNNFRKGRYIMFEAISFRDTTNQAETNNKYFAELERRWNRFTRQNFRLHNRRKGWRGGHRRRQNFYHTGKQWGWGRVRNLPEPYAFQDDRAASRFFTQHQRRNFLRHARRNDPKGVFSAGELPRLLGISSVKFDPRRTSQEESQGSPTFCSTFGNAACLSGCCCRNELLCAGGFQQCTVGGLTSGKVCKDDCSCRSRVCRRGKCL